MPPVSQTLVRHTEPGGNASAFSIVYDDVTREVASVNARNTRGSLTTRAALIGRTRGGTAEIDVIDLRSTDLTSRLWVAEEDADGALVLPFEVQFAP